MSSSTSFGSSDFALSRSSQGERLYDDSSELMLTSAATEADVDAIVMRLSQGPAGRRAFGLSGPYRTDDVTDPPDGASTSDLSQRVSYPAADADRLAPRPRQTAQHLGTDPDAKFCPECGAPVMQDEPPSQDPATAGRQVAGGLDVQAEVDRLSRLAVADSSGNRSDPPKSAAVRDAETARARPGHT